MTEYIAARLKRPRCEADERLCAGNPNHDRLGRFTTGPGGSAGPRGTPDPDRTDISKGHIDPAVRDLPFAKALQHYVVAVKAVTKFYDAHAKFFEQHEFGTDGHGVARYCDTRKGPLTTNVPTEVLQKLKLIFLDDGKGRNLGECASLVKNLTGLGNTGTWQAGPRVLDVKDLQTGTAIGTFDKEGRFKGHAAIFLFKGKNSAGSNCIFVLEQFTPKHHGKHIQIRACQ